MSWLFSQALVEASSAATCSDGQPSAQLNVMPTQHKFWRNDKTMEPSSLSRFGLTCAVLTEDRGAELLTSYLAGFRARTSASQEQATGSTELGRDSGESSRGWFATFDQASSTWRTAQRSLLGDSELFLETWPRWGSMRDGVSCLRPTPALPICESASGLWPTATASDAEQAGGLGCIASGKRGYSLHQAVRLWPTVVSSDTGSRSKKYAQGETALSLAVQTWATATARDWRSGKASQATHDKNSRPLSEQVGGLLNPAWTEWLMGWPIGWTELKPLAMDRCQSVRQWHGHFSAVLSELIDE